MYMNLTQPWQAVPTADINAGEKYVTLSVDDGHPLDLRCLALLLKYDLKATFYIPGANTERQVMNASQIREIDRHCEVGSHTLNHVRLTRVPADKAWREICDGKNFMEDTLGHEVVSFCYPGGKFNRRIAKQVKEAGFLGARTCMFNLTDFPKNPFLWGLSTYANTYPVYIHLRHAFLEGNLKGAYNLLTTFKAQAGWASHFICALEHVSRHGGIAHLYLHSWEIDKHGEWDRLEALFKLISQFALKRVTNGDSYRSRMEKRGMTSPSQPTPAYQQPIGTGQAQRSGSAVCDARK
jgi:peptidoglycan/xylan/chitin deacetylase (PgdA/CDA1 family)